MADEPFLSRWSKRKAEVRSGAPVATEPAAPVAPAPVPGAAAAPAPQQPLPAIETLTPESDFTGFMRPEVDERLKRQALRTLFRDPHFNVMDGLDIYIDDYSKPDPIPESWFSQMRQMERLGAYEEKVPDEAESQPEGAPAKAESEPEEAPEGAVIATEKPPEDQGLGPQPSVDTSDTPDSGISPPPVPE